MVSESHDVYIRLSMWFDNIEVDSRGHGPSTGA